MGLTFLPFVHFMYQVILGVVEGRCNRMAFLTHGLSISTTFAKIDYAAARTTKSVTLIPGQFGFGLETEEKQDMYTRTHLY